MLDRVVMPASSVLPTEPKVILVDENTTMIGALAGGNPGVFVSNGTNVNDGVVIAFTHPDFSTKFENELMVAVGNMLAMAGIDMNKSFPNLPESLKSRLAK